MKPFRSILFIISITLFLISSCKRDNSSLLNLDFERIDSKTRNPLNWYFRKSPPYRFSLDSTVVHNGKYSIRMENIGNNDHPTDDVAGYRQIENIQPMNNIKLTAFIKTENANADSLGIFIGCSSFEGDTVIRLKDKSLIGTNDWKEYSVEVPVKTTREYYNIGVAFFGEGKIWVDDLRFYVDDKQLFKTPPAPNFKASNKELKWLENHSIPIKTVEAGSGFEDLEPLKEMIGDARIVGLGENTHGSSEVFRMKHRLVELLATERNVFLDLEHTRGT